jgi:hypothetical protein
MNHASLNQPNKLRLTATCAELACVCLVFASILFGLGSLQMKSGAPDKNTTQLNGGNGIIITDKFVSSSNPEGGFSTTIIDGSKIEISTDENGKPIYIINGDAVNGEGNNGGIKVEFSTDEKGNSIIDDKYFNKGELSTDEKGNSIIGDQYFNKGELDSGMHTIVVKPGDTLIEFEEASPLSPANNIALLVSPFLACIALLLFALKFYGHPKSRLLLALVFGLQTVAPLILLAAGRPAALPLLTALVCLLMTVLTLLGKMNRIVALLGFVVTLATSLLDLLNGSPATIRRLGGDLITIADFVYAIGLISFLLAWFVYTFYNSTKEKAAPAETAAETTAEETAEKTAQVNEVEDSAAE